MNPGRELDKLIQEKVFGSEVVEQNQVGRPDWFYKVGDALVLVPQYSMHIASAWKVVEKAKIEAIVKMEDGRWHAHVSSSEYFGDDDEVHLQEGAEINSYYEILIYEKDETFGATAPHAICLAALKITAK